MNGKAMTRGVFKAYVVFLYVFLVILGCISQRISNLSNLVNPSIFPMKQSMLMCENGDITLVPRHLYQQNVNDLCI